MLRFSPSIPRRRSTAIRAALLLLGVLAALGNVTPAHGHTGNIYSIQMTADGFEPDRLEIIAGDSVIFENVDQADHWPASNVHPTHELYADFDAKRPILPGESWSMTFFRPGIWGFHDHLNPQYTGQITVLPDTHPVDGGESSSSAPAQAELTGLARIWAAIKRYVSAVIDAARQLVVEVYNPSVAGAPVVTQTSSASTQQLDTSFRPPPAAQFDQVYRDLQPTCPEDDFTCWVAFFRQQTVSFGPQIAADLVSQMKEDGIVSPVVDEHQLAHQIGRQTAESFGVNDQAFLLCPMSALNGGCQHGFFEFVLGRANSSSEAADLICQQLSEGYPAKDYFYCYHGVGHGVMMAAAYDLDRALSVCDEFEVLVARDGCWQGVFMENVNAGMGGFAREGVFSQDDPLAPCSELEAQYKHECYVNHAGWLMDYFDGEVEAASAACTQAVDGFAPSCLESIGLMVTNPVWQSTLYGDLEGTQFELVAWELCTRFPPDRIHSCVIGGIDNIHNFDVFEIDRATAFCNTVDRQYQELCYQRMGFNLFNQMTEIEDVIAACESVDPEFRQPCLAGAGVES